ncbi:MAG TPA: hypothetical protein PK335_10190 [Draconibacterium sp.]|nr:hypothetical protein [Draconibacterium sp.]
MHKVYKRLAGLLILILSISAYNAFAQKVLNEQETQWVNEAYEQLEDALSNPGLSQDERIRMVERSAKTLKEYGQPSGFPEGDIPLKRFMKENFDKASEQYNDVNAFRQDLAKMQLDARMKFINAVQIEMVEDEIKLMIPGKPGYDLSKDLVQTVFDWNAVEGFNEGEMGDAKALKKLFLKSAETGKLLQQMDQLFKDHQFNMQELNRDLKMVDQTEAQLRKRYELAEASTHTFKGYEGAGPKQSKPEPVVTQSISISIDPALIGTWLNTDATRTQSGWQFNSDGTAVQYIRDKRIPGWKWEVRGGMLYIIGGNNKSEDYNYKFEGGDLYMEVTLLGKQVWSAPMSKM